MVHRWAPSCEQLCTAKGKFVACHVCLLKSKITSHPLMQASMLLSLNQQTCEADQAECMVVMADALNGLKEFKRAIVCSLANA